MGTIDLDDGVAECVGNVALCSEGQQVVQAHDGAARIELLQQLLVAQVVGAAIQREVFFASCNKARQHPLAEFIQHVQLRKNIVIVESRGHLFFHIGDPFRRIETADGRPVKGGEQAEAAFYPAFQHRTCLTVGINTPVLEQEQVAGMKAPCTVAFDAQFEERVHIVAESLPRLVQVVALAQLVEQIGMRLAHSTY